MDADTQATEKRKVGRPTKYKPVYCKKLLDHFTVNPHKTITKEIKTKSGAIIKEEKLIPADPPFLTVFAKQIGVSRTRLFDWAKEHAAFRNAMTRAKELQEEMIAKNALLGLYDGGFAFKTLVNTAGWRGETKTVEVQASLEDRLAGLIAAPDAIQIEGEATDTDDDS